MLTNDSRAQRKETIGKRFSFELEQHVYNWRSETVHFVQMKLPKRTATGNSRLKRKIKREETTPIQYVVLYLFPYVITDLSLIFLGRINPNRINTKPNPNELIVFMAFR